MGPAPITLYTRVGCAESARVARRLRERHIQFVERDASTDDEAARELAGRGVFGTPLQIAGSREIFFRPDEIAGALGAVSETRESENGAKSA